MREAASRGFGDCSASTCSAARRCAGPGKCAHLLELWRVQLGNGRANIDDNEESNDDEAFRFVPAGNLVEIYLTSW